MGKQSGNSVTIGKFQGLVFLLGYSAAFVVIQYLIVSGKLDFFSDKLSFGIATFSTSIISSVDSHIVQRGTLLIHENGIGAVRIDNACNALELMLLLLAALSIYPASWLYKGKGIAFCLVGIQLFNVVRIITLYYVIELWPEYFDLVHEYIWRFLITLVALTFFLIWVMLEPEEGESSLTNT